MRKAIPKALAVIGAIAALAIGAYLILRACGFTTAEDFERLRDRLGEGIWFWLIIVALQAFQVVFIPISNQIVSAPLAMVFQGELWKVFLSSWIGIEIGTVALYLIGRFGGERMLRFVLSDQSSVDRCKSLMAKGKALYPMGMLIFIIPDDVLTALAGTAGYGFAYVLIASALTRGVCSAATVFGFGFAASHPWMWAAIIAFFLAVAAGTAFHFRKALKKEKKGNDESND